MEIFDDWYLVIVVAGLLGYEKESDVEWYVDIIALFCWVAQGYLDC